MQEDGQKKNKTKKFLTNTLIAGVVSAAAVVGTEKGQQAVNEKNEHLNHAFTVEEIGLKDKIRMLMGTSLYSNKNFESLSKEEYFENLSHKFPFLSRWLRTDSQAGLVHLYKGEMETLEQAKNTIDELRSSRDEPILVSADIEGGFVSHLGITTEDLIAHGIPRELLEVRKRETAAYWEKYKNTEKRSFVEKQIPHLTLPSQEWLGREYKKILESMTTAPRGSEKRNLAIAKRQEFLAMMEGYGETVANICDEVGINLVFGPNLDMVKDIDGNENDEKNDRSFGSSPYIVSDLAVSYLRGFGRNGNVAPIAKHFVNSGAEGDGHKVSAVAITDRNDGSISVFGDVINASSPEMYTKYLEKNNEERQKKREARRIVKKTKSGKIIYGKTPLPSRKELTTQEKIKQSQNEPGYPLGIMTSVTSSNAYSWKDKGNPVIPGAYNLRQINKIHGSKEGNQGLGHKGIIVSDDLLMKSSQAYLNALYEKSKTTVSPEAFAVHQALRAGNTIALVKSIAGSEQRIAGEVEKLVREGASFKQARLAISSMNYENGRTGPDLTEAMVDANVKKVLDLKVMMGLLEKQNIKGKEYYILDPRLYNPTVTDVLVNSFFSNQMPWTSKDQPVTSKQPSAPELLYKAMKNFSLSLYRVSFPSLEPAYKEAEKNSKKLIIVDKGVEKMFIYDLETREKEKEYTVGIGKGGLTPRRYVGDHSTPTGTYELVGKRDDAWWKKNKGVKFPDVYGGVDGGMLVLAGQWHPEIAIHGSDQKTLGQVSNGCVRVENKDIKTLMKQIPIGSMIIVTR